MISQFMKRCGPSQRVFALHDAPDKALALLQVALRPPTSPPPPVSSLFASPRTASPLSEAAATHAFFYRCPLSFKSYPLCDAPASVSVAASNAGAGLGAQVIERSLRHLQADPRLPALATFQTVSPIPGFVAWLGAGAAAAPTAWAQRHHSTLSLSSPPAVPSLSSLCFLKAAAAAYLLQRVMGANIHRVIDPVANFHLGNGAVIENIMVGLA